MSPEKKPLQSKIEQFATSGAALILSRLANLVAVPLLVIVWGSVNTGIGEAKIAAETARGAAAAAFAQAGELAVAIAALTATLQGEQRAQAIINAGLEFARADHETRIRMLEAWQRNVNGREDPV